MKITLVALGSRSAGPVYSFQMAQALSTKTNVELHVIISKEVDNLNSWDELFQSNPKISFHKIDTYKHDIKSVILSFLNLSRIRRLIKLINGCNADIVYCTFGLMWSSLVFPFIKNAKIITTVHDPHPYTHGYTLSQFLLANVGFFGEKYVTGRIVLNTKDADFVSKKYNCKVKVIPHAAYSFYLPSNYKNKETVSRKIAFMGRIDIYKGVDILVRAFAKMKTEGVKLLIAGSGQIDDKTMSIIKSNSNINLQNRYIANEEIPKLMEDIDIIVLPYTNATQSGVIPMAFAFGKTVIATDVGSLSEQVPKGTGVLVTPDAESIASAIDQMYVNEEKIIEYSKNAKEYADRELTWEHSADLLVDFANSL